MIATILPSSTNFHAVGYNEHKVSKGVASLLEILNFDTVGLNGKPTPEELTHYLQAYSSRNSRIQKAQFHVAISCKGHEMTEEQLLDFAHRYLKEMGYMEQGQPILIYAHHDTDNTHLHIVTSRVAPDGRKIDHDHERRRSQEVIDKILGNDRKLKVSNDLKAAKQYTFSTFAQFKAVLQSMGYECYKKDDTIFIKHGGKVQRPLLISEIEALYKYGMTDRQRCRQLRGILTKYRDVCANKEELQKEMKAKFGIDLVFFGRRDKPYGYMIVDQANKTVINGARVLSTEQLLDFATPEQRINRVEDCIDRLLAINPKITQGEINKRLWKQSKAYIKKGVLYVNGQPHPLKPTVAEAIDQNNRIAFVEKYQPTTEAERELLCKFYKVNASERVSLSSERPKQYTEAVNQIRGLFDDKSVDNLRDAIKNEGYVIRQEADATYAIDFHRHIIVNMNAEGFDVKRIQWQRKQIKTSQTHKTANHLPHMPKFRDAGGGSQSEKREWEVGQKGNYDEVDDGKSLKR